MKEIIRNAIILFGITIVAGTLLGVTYSVTKEPIEEQKIIQRNKALNNVMPNANFDTELEIKGDFPMISNIYESVIDGQVVGYAFNLISSEGYGGDIELVVGIDTSGVITGIDIIKHAETPGLGAKADEEPFKSQFTDKLATLLTVIKGETTQDEEVAAISGATITSRAVTNAVNEAITYYENELIGGVE